MILPFPSLLILFIAKRFASFLRNNYNKKIILYRESCSMWVGNSLLIKAYNIMGSVLYLTKFLLFRGLIGFCII